MLQIGRSLVRSQLVSLQFFIDTKSFRSHCGPGVDSASNRNEYQEYFLWGKGGRCVRLTTLPSSCAVVTKSGNRNWNRLGHSRPLTGGFTFTFTLIQLPPSVHSLREVTQPMTKRYSSQYKPIIMACCHLLV